MLILYVSMVKLRLSLENAKLLLLSLQELVFAEKSFMELKLIKMSLQRMIPRMGAPRSVLHTGDSSTRRWI